MFLKYAVVNNWEGKKYTEATYSSQCFENDYIITVSELTEFNKACVNSAIVYLVSIYVVLANVPLSIRCRLEWKITVNNINNPSGTG